MPLKIETDDCSPGILKLSGSLEIRDAEALSQALSQALANNRCVILDLTAIEACDIAGLQVLLAAKQTAETQGIEFCIEWAPALAEACAAAGLAPEHLHLSLP